VVVESLTWAIAAMFINSAIINTIFSFYYFNYNHIHHLFFLHLPLLLHDTPESSLYFSAALAANFMSGSFMYNLSYSLPLHKIAWLPKQLQKS
jgi:hypothetical protein